MYHNIIHQLLWQIMQTIIEIEISFTAAASPASFLVPDCNPFERHSDLWCIIHQPLHKMRPDFIFLTLRQGIICRNLIGTPVCLLFLLAPGHLLLCRSNPRRMGVQKAQHLFLCHPVWNSCHDSSVQPYLKCHCFAL